MTDELHTDGTIELWKRGKAINVIYGLIYGDAKKRYEDGQFIQTSKIVSIEGDIVYTKNSTYKLGEPFNE